MFSPPKILFLVSLLFCSTIEFNPYLPFEFLIFLFVCFLYMLSIHNNLSAGAQNVTQNVTGAYVIIMLVYRHLLTTRLHDKAVV